jgi:hypothetical protein
MRTSVGSSWKIGGKHSKNKILMEQRFVNHSVFVKPTTVYKFYNLIPPLPQYFAHMHLHFIMYSVNCKSVRFEVLRAVLLTITVCVGRDAVLLSKGAQSLQSSRPADTRTTTSNTQLHVPED